MAQKTNDPKLTDYSVTDALALIDRRFGKDRLLRDLSTPTERLVTAYYLQSRWGYERYNPHAAMHMALSDDGKYTHDGLRAQADTVIAEARKIGARRILELGCGQAFNARVIAEALPEVEVVATDLIEAHITKANERGAHLPNFRAVRSSFTELPVDLGQFDLIFAVETLCHSPEIDAVIERVKARLAPGGTFMFHDAFRRTDWESKSDDLKEALVLNELCLAVPHGYAVWGTWEDALARAGFTDVTTEDISMQGLGTCRRLGRVGLKFLTQWKYRLLRPFVPKHLARNAVAGFLGIYIMYGGAVDPASQNGITRYGLIRAVGPKAV